MPNSALKPPGTVGGEGEAAATSLSVEFCIAPDHPALPGHFPDNPIVPGVVLLQRVLEHIRLDFGLAGPFTLIDAKFLRPLRPGQRCTLELRRSGGQTLSFAFRMANEPLARGAFRDVSGQV